MLYLATTQEDALAELVEPGTLVSLDFFRDRALAVLDLSEIEFADLQSPAARAFGISSEVTTGRDYTLGQDWASALERAGFGGLAFPSERRAGSTLLALFGAEGPGKRLKIIQNTEISNAMLEKAGITAVDRPALADLKILR